MDSRGTRAVRGILAAGFATLVAALSHILGGGTPPSAAGMTATFALSAMVCTVLAGGRMSLPRLTASVAISQGMFHLVFVGLGDPAALSHHWHSAQVFLPTATAPYATSAGTGSMWIAHGIAAAATVLAFRFGERAIRVLAAVGRRVFAAWRPSALAPIARPAAISPRPVVHRGRARAFPAWSLRGPPARSI